MKVVLFCGGLGMRLRDYSDQIPKPMVNVGNRPIIWHLMKYYAHFGHKDFILCLGHQAEYIKSYFLKYDECLSNDFVLTEGGSKLDLIHKDIHDWRITFTDTGARTNIGGRLRNVRRFLRDEEVFLANYSDNLSDLNLDKMVFQFLKTDAVAGFVCVKPNISYHFVHSDADGQVKEIVSAQSAELWTNGGFFVFRQAIFDYLLDGEELVEAPFRRLIEAGKLYTYRFNGFWACMDTFKEKQQLDDLVHAGSPPWQVWDNQDLEVQVPESTVRTSKFKIVSHA
jgi:glucose-1-phosphate cytidylyltransferase